MFCVKRPNQHQQHSARIDHPFVGAFQHHHMEEVVEGMQHKHSSLEQCHKHRGSTVRVIKSPYLDTPQLLDVDTSKVHPLVGNLFHIKARQAPLTGNFIKKNWKKLTQDLNIFSIVLGFKIRFSQTLFYFGPPQLPRVNQEEMLQINSEIKEMFRKGEIQQVKSEPGKFLSNLVLVNKKDGGYGPVINLKFPNSFIPYQHFKIKDLLQEYHFLINKDLKDPYSTIPLDKSSRKYIRFIGKEIYTIFFAYVLA